MATHNHPGEIEAHYERITGAGNEAGGNGRNLMDDTQTATIRSNPLV